MQALDDFYYFAKVIEHGGYAKAARALRIPKSRLSRHVTALESRLGVRLVNRSTRRFVITDVGQEVRRHALAMLSEADAAVEAVEFARAEPRGIIRVACPVALAQSVLAALVPEFLSLHPSIRLLLDATNRVVDVLNEGYDLALRVRTIPTGEDGLVMRAYGSERHLLVASPGFLQKRGQPATPADLSDWPTLSSSIQTERQSWHLLDASGAGAEFEHTPRLLSPDFPVILTAAIQGLGIALLPERVVRTDLAAGRLQQVLSDWSLPLGVFHVVFPTRRGLLPSVRAFLDFLGERLRCNEA